MERTNDDTAHVDKEKPPTPSKQVSPHVEVKEELLDEVPEEPLFGAEDEPLIVVKQEPFDDFHTAVHSSYRGRKGRPHNWYIGHMKTFCPREKRVEDLCWHDQTMASKRFDVVFDALARQCPPKESWRKKALYQGDSCQRYCWLCYGQLVDTNILIIRSAATKTSHTGYTVHEVCFKALANTEQSPEAVASNFRKEFREAVPEEIGKPIIERMTHSYLKIKMTTVAKFISNFCTFTTGISKCINPACGKANDHREIIHCDVDFCSSVIHYSCLDKVDNIFVCWQVESWTCGPHRDGVTSFVMPGLRNEREHYFYPKYLSQDTDEAYKHLKTICFPTACSPFAEVQCLICVARGVSTEACLTPMAFVPNRSIILACCEVECFVHKRCIQAYVDELKRLDLPLKCPNPHCTSTADFTASMLGAQGIKFMLYPRRSDYSKVLIWYSMTPATQKTARMIQPPEGAAPTNVEGTPPTNTEESHSDANDVEMNLSDALEGLAMDEDVVTLDGEGDIAVEEVAWVDGALDNTSRSRSISVVTISSDSDDAMEKVDENVRAEKKGMKPPLVPRQLAPIFSASSTTNKRRPSAGKMLSTLSQPEPKDRRSEADENVRTEKKDMKPPLVPRQLAPIFSASSTTNKRRPSAGKMLSTLSQPEPKDRRSEADENVRTEKKDMKPPILPRQRGPIVSASSTTFKRRPSAGKTPSTVSQPKPKKARRSGAIDLDDDDIDHDHILEVPPFGHLVMRGDNSWMNQF